MTNKQFRARLEALGNINQHKAASLFGVSLRTINGWANHDPIPHWVEWRFQMLSDPRELNKAVRLEVD